jgi:murein DD-endopeptidase MepM/ murein hydrolase activator NlpD
MIGLAHFARWCALATALTFVGALDAEAKPRKKKSSHVERSKKKSKKDRKAHKQVVEASQPEVRDEDREEPPDDFATMLDTFADDPTPTGISKLNVRDPEAVAAAFPAFTKWIHPIVRVEELVSAFPGREFGARRKGIDRSRGCGGGHCGIDLHAENGRGRPIVAVSPGILVKVERRRSGGDGMSGRNVRLRHEDGTFTTYMHLDSVMKGLEVGDEVTAGQQLGTLGSTGVSSHSPHLHFAVEVPIKKDNGKGDHKRGYTRWIDPAPFLMMSRVIEKAIRKHSTKPSS